MELETEKETKSEELNIAEIAKAEGIKPSKLKKYFKELNDIKKAIFTAKYQERKGTTVHIVKTRISLYDMSLLLGIRHRDLTNLLNEGISISQIKDEYIANKTKFYEWESILEFCIKNKLDFAYIYRMTKTYGKQLSDAIQIYRKSPDAIPATEIYEKYDKQFEKLGIVRLQEAMAIENMSRNKISFEEAVEGIVIRKNSIKRGIYPECGEALYSLAKTRKFTGKNIQPEIQLDENEEEFIKECEKELAEPKGLRQDGGER